MTLGTRAALVLLVVGCTGPPAPEAQPAPPDAAAPQPAAAPLVAVAPPPRPVGDMLLTPDTVADLAPQPTPAGRVERPYAPASYAPPHDGKTPAPTPLPVLPVRRPTRVVGDLRFLAPGSAAGGVAVFPGGKRLAFGTCVFDAASGELDAAYEPAGNSVHRLAVSPDGTRLYCGEGPLSYGPASHTRLAVRDVPGKQQLLSVPVSAWGLSGDGRLLVTLEHVYYDPYADHPGPRPAVAHFYPAVRVYDTATWKGVAAYRVRAARPTTVAVSPDGGRLVIGCDGGAVRVWDRAAGREVAAFRELCETPYPHHTPGAHLLAFSPDGKTLAATNARLTGPDTPRQVAWWRWPEGTLVHVRPVGRYHDASDLRFSPDGTHLFCGLPNGAVVWDARSGEVVTALDRDRDKRAVPAVSFAAPDRVYAAGGTRPALLRFPSLEPVAWPDRPFDDAPKAPFPLAGPVPSPDTREGRNADIELPDGSRLHRPPVFEGGVQLLDKAGAVVRHFEKGRVVEFDATPDGKLLAAYGHNANGQGFDYPLRLWDVATGAEAAAIRVYPRPDYALRFSPDGRRLAVRHSDGLVRVWDVAARRPLFALDPDGHWPARLTYSRDGRFLVGGTDRSPVLVVWNATDDGG